jgi:hypothetical protein
MNFDYSKRNKTLKHYFEFSISMANLFSVVAFLQNIEGISFSLPVNTGSLDSLTLTERYCSTPTVSLLIVYGSQACKGTSS